MPVLVKRGQRRKPLTFRIANRLSPHRPPFSLVVEQLYRQYAKHRGLIIGKTLKAPAGSTTRQLQLALTKVRERWLAGHRGR